MICPNCGGFLYPGQALDACDMGEPDCIPGSRCPECEACIPDDEWEEAQD